ncbi:MAG: penicillin acylase family protein, partial [Thermoplasmata archaeon]
MEISHKKSFIISIVAIAIVLVFIDVPLGPLPPVKNIFNPSSGVWSEPPPPYIPGASFHNITQNGKRSEIMVYNEADGFIGIYSNTTWGLYYEQGYLEAMYRLEQMDILKRTSEGNLSAILGPSELSTDIFFRDLNDYKIAQEEVANLSDQNLTYIAVSEFVDGINAYINNLTPASMPVLFKILDFTPHDWTITDVFSIQQLFLWENSAGGFDPVYFNYALMKMPENVIRAFYPAYPAGIQNPIVPYALNPYVYDETGDISNLTMYSPSYNYTDNSVPVIPSIASGSNPIPSNYPGGFPLSDLQYNVYRDFGSNDWAVNGIKTSNVSSLLANDPHLTTSVPSIWMGFQLVSPGQNVIGVVFPGFPGVVLGHNPYLAWGATNGQIQETYFYAEQINPSNRYEFFFDGSWHHFLIENETVQVKGSAPVKISVESAPNGIVFMNTPDTIAMDWTGFYPTNELGFFLHIDRSKSINQFVNN